MHIDWIWPLLFCTGLGTGCASAGSQGVQGPLVLVEKRQDPQPCDEAGQTNVDGPGVLEPSAEPTPGYVAPTEYDPPPAIREATVNDMPYGEALANAARGFVGQKEVVTGDVRYRQDCSGLVTAVFERLDCGVDVGEVIADRGGSSSLWADCEAQGLLLEKGERPEPGDLVFFDNTYDRNRNKKCDDELTHVGIVVEVRDDGTAVFVHLGHDGVRESYVNPVFRWSSKDGAGNPLNSQIRVKKKKDRRCTRYMAGELFRGYCRYRPPCRDPSAGLPDAVEGNDGI